MTAAKLDTHAPEAVPSLPIGTTLSGDQFTITDHLAAGGFGITYRAQDNVLGRTVVIKECYYEEFCFRSGKSVVARSKSYAKPMRSIVSMFMREARSLAKLRHPNIVGVHRAFEENDTAYMVLDLIEGRDLFDIIETPLSPARVQDILVQLLDAIERIHAMDLLHRDISPDNILIEENGTPVLIDFGAARAEASRHTRAISSLLVVKDGYSPHEFYVAGSNQAPCSDLYALAATFYHVLSGQAPPNSQSRMVEIAGRKPDPCVPLAGRIEGYDEEFLQAIDTAMEIHPADRLQSAAKWKSLIANMSADMSAHPAKRVSSADVSLDLELKLTRLVEETNDEVRRISQQPPKPEVVASKPEKAAKPSWIEEFNKETFTPPPKPVIEEPEPEVEIWEDPDDDALGDCDAQPFPVVVDMPKAPKGETNWVGRAIEKQERILSEQLAALELLEAEEEGRTTSRRAEDPAREGEEEVTTVVKYRPARIAAGLFISLCFALSLRGLS
ncbi:MAG: serine/threonine protein kinase [Boseongicola sp.]|nr:serine/threonine protein kinase [Boseongicola sp.]